MHTNSPPTFVPSIYTAHMIFPGSLGKKHAHQHSGMQEERLFGVPSLPDLPPNAHVLLHENKCYDWGTIGWALQRDTVDTSLYHYFIFMNSSVRGPFLPAYVPVRPLALHINLTK